MASNWIRLECESRDRGWTGELPASQYAAWAKFLLEVKANGKLGGRISADHFLPRVLRNLRISQRTWDNMMLMAEAHGAVEACEDDIIVVKWNQFQEDPTAARRQEEWRKRQQDVTDVTETPLRNGCNADVTGRDGTGRDRKTPPISPSEFPPPEALTHFTLTYCQAFPRRATQHATSFRLPGWRVSGNHKGWYAWAESQSSGLLLSLTVKDLHDAKAWGLDRNLAFGPGTLDMWLDQRAKTVQDRPKASAQNPLIQEFSRLPTAVSRKYLVAHDNDYAKAAKAWKEEQEKT